MCPLTVLMVMNKKDHNRELLFRVGGLLFIAMIGLAIMGCGLALAFGSYRLSTILFFGVIIMLVLIKLVFRRWE